jgi:hypothetical protein
MVRLAHIRLVSAVLVGADPTDEGPGLTHAPEPGPAVHAPGPAVYEDESPTDSFPSVSGPGAGAQAARHGAHFDSDAF